MSVSFLNRGEGRVAYEVTGNGPLVVCLPGVGVLRDVYRFTVPALVEAGFRVAVMDLRGHGDSDATFSSYDDVAAGTDALALVEQLGGPAVLVGNSMGAGAAVWAAAERPAAIAGIALLGPFVRNPAQNSLQPLLFRLLIARPWGPSVWRSYYRSSYPSRLPADFDEHQRRQSTALRSHWHAFARTTRTDHTPARDRLPAVKAPSLVVMGTKDKDWPDPAEEARFVANALHADLVLVDGAGHYPMAEFPEVVNPALVALIQQSLARG